MIDLNSLEDDMATVLGQHELVLESNNHYTCDSRLWIPETCDWNGEFFWGTDAREAHRAHVAKQIVLLLASWELK